MTPAETEARALAAVEEALRRLGFAESTIKRRRSATRAEVRAHLSTKPQTERGS